MLLTVHSYFSVMHLHKGLYQSQPDTGTGIMHIHLIKAFKDMGQLFFRHADSRIGNFQTNPGFLIFSESRQAYGYFSIVGRKLEGIRQQVVSDAFHHLRIGYHIIQFSIRLFLYIYCKMYMLTI